MGKVVVIGSANTDLTVKADRLPRPGETVTGGEFMMSYGGKGANQGLAASKAGSLVTLLAKIGRDRLGDSLYRHLKECGFPREGLLRSDKSPGGVAVIAVDKSGDNQIAVAPGSNRDFSVKDFLEAEPLLEGASVLLVQLEIPMPTVLKALERAKSKGMLTILDPAPFARLPERIYPLIDVITPNEREAEALTDMEVRGVEDAGKAGSRLCSRGCGTAIITMGARGAVMRCEGTTEHIPPFQVRPVDSVASGDAFNGALASAMAEGKPISESIRFASAAGALSATKRGAQESLPVKGEIEGLLHRVETG